MRWLRDPFVLFLVAGASLFLLERTLAGDDDHVVRITGGDIERLAAQWQAQAGRAPSLAELDALIEDLIREEILYREALALGLDRDDTIIRRRLAQKMAFLLEDTALAPDPGEADLRAFFAAERDRFRQPSRMSFNHIYLNESRRRDSLDANVAALLAALGEDGSAWRTLGDPFVLARSFTARSAAEIAGRFGPAFAAAVEKLPLGSWEGPVRSAYGAHLVQVVSRQGARMPAFEEVREAVREAWRRDARERANEAAWQAVRERYEVERAPD